MAELVKTPTLQSEGGKIEPQVALFLFFIPPSVFSSSAG